MKTDPAYEDVGYLQAVEQPVPEAHTEQKTPGSTSTFVYDPASDRLRGKYFQAVEKQTFYIEFLRAK